MLIKKIFVACLLLHAIGVVSYAEMPGDVSVSVRISEDMPDIDTYLPRMMLYVLNDQDNIEAHIEQWKEESKDILEPLVRQYMLTAETLLHVTSRAHSLEVQKEQARLLSQFASVKQAIESYLTDYRQRIEHLIDHYTVRRVNVMSAGPDAIVLCGFPPGKYRIYGIVSFATTTLRWFEAVTLKGGDRQNIVFTRENMTNPYWTDLDWWSFMNLDFSKHHN